jgi:hypothetical protein
MRARVYHPTSDLKPKRSWRYARRFEEVAFGRRISLA